MRIVRQIYRGTDPVPAEFLPPEPAAAQRGMIFPERNHILEKPENVLIRPESVPIKPPNFVVLVVGIVVAKLGVQELVPGPEHRCAVGQQEQAAEILYLLPAQCADRRGHAFIPLLPTIPTIVFVRAVLIVIAVLPVALAVIGDEIVQREAVVGSYVIHTLERVISVGAAVRKQVIAAIETAHHLRNHPCVALYKTANVVAKSSVP